MKFNYKNKKINLEAKECNSFEKFSGLMFTKRKNAKALLFEFKKPTRISIHSWFVKFDFIGVWLDNNNNVIEIRKVRPWKVYIKPKKPFSKLIEIPVNEEYRNVLKRINYVY